MTHTVSFKINDEELIIETGRMAKQSNGSVFVKYAGSAVLATACASDRELVDIDFIPISVEYNEKYYAAGKIPGGFLKREARPHNKEILVSRLIDRPMRPLFHKDFKREIQIVPTTISTDQVNPPDILAMIGAATAVFISDIPFDGPVASVRVAFVDGDFVINPTFAQIESSTLEIIVSGTEKGITMVEGGADEVSEEQMLQAIDKAHETIQGLCEMQKQLRELAGKPKMEVIPKEEVLDIKEELHSFVYDKMKEACFVIGKFQRYDAIKAVKKEALEHFEEKIPEEQVKLFESELKDIETKIVRESILKDKKRTDGRGPEDIRKITCEVDILPRTHGAALFTRGETQSLAVTTLGSVYDEKILDDIDGDVRKNFMLHYNFPPFSVGETGRLMTGRREIGHGHLAERALQPMLPEKENFPYTIRLVSEILESNGSSSMATICGGTMALLNAGVPMKKSVAGIAMGLIADGDDFVVLSDILGEEDHLGDMDFKVAGTEEGITAFQMDIKIDSVSPAIMAKALAQAHDGRLKILGIMKDTISGPREDLSDFAPKIIAFKIKTDKIGMVIGPGGKTIKQISEDFDSSVNIDNDGKVTIFSKTQEGAKASKKFIDSLLEEPVIGKIYEGKVTRIEDYGAFIEYLPGKDGLCHKTRISREPVRDMHEVVKLEQKILVKIVDIDNMNRVNLSVIDAVNPDGTRAEEGIANVEIPARGGRDRGGRDGGRDGGRRGGFDRDRNRSRDRDSRDRDRPPRRR